MTTLQLIRSEGILCQCEHIILRKWEDRYWALKIKSFQTDRRRTAGICKPREAVCVHVEKVYDNCREKDCIVDTVVDFVDAVQDLIQNAVKVKTKDAEVVAVLADLEDVPFKERLLYC